MGMLATIAAFFKNSTVLMSAVEFLSKAFNNKFVLMAILAVGVLWIYDTKVQAEYTAKHAQQEIAALTESLKGYETAFRELAVHTSKVYLEHNAMEDVVEAPLPAFNEVMNTTGLADLREDMERRPEVIIKHVDKVTLDVFTEIEDRLNGGEDDN